MPLNSLFLASGPGWRVSEFVCTSGPQDRPFEEQHKTDAIAIVTAGTFRYRNGEGEALLGPGSLLLGNRGGCFECGHEHSTGDRCLSFHFTPRFQEAVASALPGARTTRFSAPRLPPLSRLAPLLAQAESACGEKDVAAFEEIALRLSAAVMVALSGLAPLRHSPARRDMRRIAEALQRIEAQASERLTLAGLARDAGMSPYHFLRTFRQVAGMTPHQFILRTRLHKAALLLRASEDSISQIALDAGFEDLSTFNRRFRRVMGVTPGAYRAQ